MGLAEPDLVLVGEVVDELEDVLVVLLRVPFEQDVEEIVCTDI